MTLITIKPKSVEPERGFLATGTICRKTQKQTKWWKKCFDCLASILL